MMDDKSLTPKTRFGKRRGWEVQHLMLGTKHFWRVTGKGWCRPATREEVQLWRIMKGVVPGDFKVWP